MQTDAAERVASTGPAVERGMAVGEEPALSADEHARVDRDRRVMVVYRSRAGAW